jgi:hypothetical protein
VFILCIFFTQQTHFFKRRGSEHRKETQNTKWVAFTSLDPSHYHRAPTRFLRSHNGKLIAAILWMLRPHAIMARIVTSPFQSVYPARQSTQNNASESISILKTRKCYGRNLSHFFFKICTAYRDVNSSYKIKNYQNINHLWTKFPKVQVHIILKDFSNHLKISNNVNKIHFTE